MKIGIILRAFAKKSEQVETQAKAVFDTAMCLKGLSIKPGSPFFFDGVRPALGMVDMVVPINKEFLDVDCGLTGLALREVFKQIKNDANWFRIRNTTQGLFCGTLNETIVRQAREGCTHSLVVSSGCLSYITEENLGKLIEAAKEGALATGLAIEALSESIMAGRLANTFAMWQIDELLTLGGFDLRAENARVGDLSQRYLRGRTPEGADAYYPLAGVEEIIPLIRLVGEHGKCIKPVIPTSGLWKAPEDEEGYKRHVAKLATKFERQAAFAHQLGVDFSFIESGVMQ